MTNLFVDLCLSSTSTARSLKDMYSKLLEVVTNKDFQ